MATRHVEDVVGAAALVALLPSDQQQLLVPAAASFIIMQIATVKRHRQSEGNTVDIISRKRQEDFEWLTHETINRLTN